jgi:hypothetical protein
LEAERDTLRGELALVRLAYASVITERGRLKGEIAEIKRNRAALSGEGVT